MEAGCRAGYCCCCCCSLCFRRRRTQRLVASDTEQAKQLGLSLTAILPDTDQH